LSTVNAASATVTARICEGSNAPLRTWHAIRCVIMVGLPVPAPARMATAEREGRLPLGVVQSGEDVLEIGHRADPSTGP